MLLNASAKNHLAPAAAVSDLNDVVWLIHDVVYCQTKAVNEKIE